MVVAYSGYDRIDEKPEKQLPNHLELLLNHPNPFNSSTVISYRLPQAGNVALTLVDLSGKQLSVLVKHWHAAGTYQINFDGKDLPSGSYFLYLRTDAVSATKKIVLLK